MSIEITKQPHPRIASCSCGQLTAEAVGEPVRISICHCLACQRRTGSVFGEQARFPRSHVVVSGASTEYVRVGDEGTRVTFHFCPRCGATVYYELEGLEEFVAIPVGAFADPGFPTPRISVYESRKHGWVVPPPDAEHMP
ncbi:MAG: GFA family protein [Steroidobacteraceae bacterium]